MIRGARETIRRHRPAIYAENDREDASPALIGLLLELDYRCYWHLPPYVRIPNFRGDAVNAFPGLVSINLLCVPRGDSGAIQGFREALSPQDSWRDP